MVLNLIGQDNATASGAYREPFWVCNLLAAEPAKDCGIVLR